MAALAHAVHNGLTAIPASHALIHGEKVAFGLLTQLLLAGRHQAEIDEIYRDQKAVGLPITLAAVGAKLSVSGSGLRRGTTSLLAALAVATAAMFTHCMPGHRHQHLLGFLRQIETCVPEDLSIP